MPLPKGFKHSEETKEKISNSLKGIRRSPFTEEHKKKISLSRIGKFGEDNNPAWKGGKKRDSNGYILVCSPYHPYKDANNYVYEHRLVVGKTIGRYLLPMEKVHHLGDKDDNRPRNLMAFVNHSAHKRFEQGGIVKPEEIIFDGENK